MEQQCTAKVPPHTSQKRDGLPCAITMLYNTTKAPNVLKLIATTCFVGFTALSNNGVVVQGIVYPPSGT